MDSWIQIRTGHYMLYIEKSITLTREGKGVTTKRHVTEGRVKLRAEDI